ncbi:tkl protein kinase [Plasmopara halstedii]|uniref:Tkl protein kinase n=1 Tax=Plasmopara halstedii TaxID=4781 RepID=A0A0N7L3Z7_PLAHL|nr:tkl protein kinase [Plasmopara halstedii]CEG37267.1 tkl protein kinase [Plasmopara halstedii]|eukprot:XP_024573636.1 tkl protein kinase [Plasmopara halstedii]
MATPSNMLSYWQAVHWTSLGAGAAAALFLLLHSSMFHRPKRRMADLLLSGIALADLTFVGIEAIKQALRTSYLARCWHEDEYLKGLHYTTKDFILTLLSRFSFFMSFYWTANLSLLLRLGSLEALHIKRSLLLSSLTSLVYGCMHALLPTLSEKGSSDFGLAYTVTAVLVFVMQLTPLLLIVVNLRAVKKSRLNASVRGRNIIRRLTGYCLCAIVFTLPYAFAVIFSRSCVGVGVVAETLTYFITVTNALLFGTSFSCCCFCVKATETALPAHEVKLRCSDTPSSSIDISAGVMTEESETPDSTGYTALTTNGVSDSRGGLHVGSLNVISEMVTDEAAVKIGEGSSSKVYKAQWLGITVALKCLRLYAGDTTDTSLYMTHLAELRAEFLDEAGLAAQLRHPNITLFIKLGTYKKSLCLVNEYCARGSLRDVLRANPLMEWNTRVRLAFEAAKDFGIARIATNFSVQKQVLSQQLSAQSLYSLQSINESLCVEDNAASELTTFAGTWRWNAPEIMKNPSECQFNRETDMYSFGMSLWEILTNGAVPFGNVNFDHQVRQLVAAGERPALPPAYLRHAPSEFIDIMCACWHQRPHKRPSAQNVMLQLGSLSNSMWHSSDYYFSSQDTARFAYSSSYSHAMDSNQSCPIFS